MTEERLVLRNELGELRRLADFIEQYAEKFALPDKTLFAAQLCLDEAVSNVIRHGEDAAKATRITVTVNCTPDELSVRVADDGVAFDPTGVAQPKVAASLEEAKIGGLGVHLIRNFSRSMQYARVASENQLCLTFPR